MFRLRRISQVIFTIVYNFYLYGFLGSGIYQGMLKMFPCPGFNCHSCPSAIFVCPIGALQLFASYGKYFVSFYVLGALGLLGSLAGRIVCGWACPFGLLQDILYKIPSPKIKIPRILENMRYIFLFGGVFFIAFLTKEPWFCKVICPVGTLEAGIPLLVMNADLREMIGTVFYVKMVILIALFGWMVISSRAFCRVICPLGAIYGLFNKVSFVKMIFIREKCIMDKKCEKVCPVGHRMYVDDAASPRCIRCMQCLVCPTKAIIAGFSSKDGELK